VDDIEKCGFIFPSIVHEGDITVGISTSGKSPVYAKFLRLNIEDMLDGYYMKIFETLSRFRPYVREHFDNEKQRKEAMETVFEICLSDENIPDDDEIKTILERVETGYENQNRNP
ncbi:MAG: hypothetical protein PUA51_03245, partial [Oscillospiraceae bacterium]|nr:hypothetical protein [Oscillospiraceae bacterium]